MICFKLYNSHLIYAPAHIKIFYIQIYWVRRRIKNLCNFIEIALQHRCSPVNLLHIFKTPFPKDISRQLLLKIYWPLLLELEIWSLFSEENPVIRKIWPNNFIIIAWKKLIPHKWKKLILFTLMFHFYTPWKHQKTKSFLTFSGGIEIGHWREKKITPLLGVNI